MIVRSRGERQGGFTLLERSVAGAMLSFIMVLMYQSLGQTIETRNMVEDGLRGPKVANAIFAQVFKDFRYIYYGGLQGDTGFRGQEAEPEVVRAWGLRVDNLLVHLRGSGIGCDSYYSCPLHLQPVFSNLGYKPGDIPECELAGRQTLALPVWPELTDDEQGRVVKAVNLFYNK